MVDCSRLGESSDDHDTAATEFGAFISDSEEAEEDSPILCDSNSDEDVRVESQARLLSVSLHANPLMISCMVNVLWEVCVCCSTVYGTYTYI